MKKNRLQIAWNGRLTQKTLPFSTDVKMIPAYLIPVSKAFLKEYPVILIQNFASRTRGPEGGYPWRHGWKL